MHALESLKATAPHEVPVVINGKPIKTGQIYKQVIPTDHKTVLANVHEANPALVKEAIEGALKAQREWEALPINDKMAIFLKAADLLSQKYRYKIMAATMLGRKFPFFLQFLNPTFFFL